MSESLQQLPVYGLDVKSCGARGDGSADDAPAIQAALERGAPLLWVPAGNYKIGRTLRLPSGTRLLAHPRARFFLAPGAGADQESFLLANAEPQRGAENLTIEGGIWDGNNHENRRGPDRPGSYTGVLIDFRQVRNLTLRGLTVRNAESYFIRLCEARNFVIEDIVFETQFVRPNQDGVHLGGFCEDGLIRRLAAAGPDTPNDDVVALNADDACGRAMNLGLKCGPIRRIRVEDLDAVDCHTFVRLLSVDSPLEDVTVERVRGGCRCCAINADAARQCAVPVFDPADPRYARGVGEFRRIVCADFAVTKNYPGQQKPLIHLMSRCHGFTIKNFHRDPARDACPQAPTLEAADLPPTAMIFEGLAGCQVAGLTANRQPKPTALRRVDSGPNSGRAEIRLAAKETLTLAAGGFAQFTADEM